MQSASDSVSSPAAVGVNLIDFFDVTPHVIVAGGLQ